MSRIAIVTGATRNLGLVLARTLAQRLAAEDFVYLTGRNADRVAASVACLEGACAQVVGHALDVADTDATVRLADAVAERHGGVDVVISNHYYRTDPEDDPAAVIGPYVAANNLGTTEILRRFAPLLRNQGRLLVVASRAGSLRALAPALHSRFDRAETLEDVDRAICAWRDAVLEGRAAGEAWPAWINIPSKVGQVAAVRALAAQRREADLARGILIAAVSPGLIDTGASRSWLDMAGARSPEEVGPPIADFALQRELDPAHYGALVHLGTPEPMGAFGSLGFGQVVPWR